MPIVDISKFIESDFVFAVTANINDTYSNPKSFVNNL